MPSLYRGRPTTACCTARRAGVGSTRGDDFLAGWFPYNFRLKSELYSRLLTAAKPPPNQRFRSAAVAGPPRRGFPPVSDVTRDVTRGARPAGAATRRGGEWEARPGFFMRRRTWRRVQAAIPGRAAGWAAAAIDAPEGRQGGAAAQRRVDRGRAAWYRWPRTSGGPRPDAPRPGAVLSGGVRAFFACAAGPHRSPPATPRRPRQTGPITDTSPATAARRAARGRRSGTAVRRREASPLVPKATGL